MVVFPSLLVANCIYSFDSDIILNVETTSRHNKKMHEARLVEIPPSHKRVYCYVGGIFTGHRPNTAIGINCSSVGRMKMLQRQKIGRNLAQMANVMQLIYLHPVYAYASSPSFSILLISTDLSHMTDHPSPAGFWVHCDISAVRSTEQEYLSKSKSFGQFFYLSKRKSSVEKCYLSKSKK